MPTRSTLWQRFTHAVFGNTISRAVAIRVKLAVAEIDRATDRLISSGGQTTQGWRDRYAWDRYTILLDALAAWRENAWARQIVELTTNYVVGAGITIEHKDEATNKFLHEWWDHRLNRMDVRVMEWCDELTRAGELFPLLSTSEDGMTYVRAVSAQDIEDIVTAPNDVEQPQKFIGRQDAFQNEPPAYTAFDDADDDGLAPRMVHYPLNRPVGAKFGESDLSQILKWFARKSSWLEDRLRLNHFRQAFLWIVKGVFENEAARRLREAELNANPPRPGSIVVADQNETWEVAHPKLDSFEAGQDGLAVTKAIGVGAGVPIHFLGEPESATRTTAESAGGPTFRHYQRRQIFFIWLLRDVIRIVLARRARVDKSIEDDAGKDRLIIRGTDISTRDNAALAVAATQIVTAFIQLYDRGLVDEEELIRLTYTFAGELVDVQELLKKVVPPRVAAKPAAPAVTDKQPDVNNETGDVATPKEP